MEDMVVPLDFTNVEGETAEQFVERNRKAIIVEMFRRAMIGDRVCMDLVGKIVSAPFIQKSRVLALNGNTVAFEGIAGTPGLDKLLDSMKRGEIKTDSLKVDTGGSITKNEAIAVNAVRSGKHEVAQADIERRRSTLIRKTCGRTYEPPAPELLEVVGDE